MEDLAKLKNVTPDVGLSQGYPSKQRQNGGLGQNRPLKENFQNSSIKVQ